MKTAEEILDTYWQGYVDGILIRMDRNYVLKAMEEYSTQQNSELTKELTSLREKHESFVKLVEKMRATQSEYGTITTTDIMTTKDKERIEEAAKKYVTKTTLYGRSDQPIGSGGRSYYETELRCFKAGAEYENPIAYNQGWNDAVENILIKLMQKWYKKDASTIYDEVEKLKKEI